MLFPMMFADWNPDMPTFNRASGGNLSYDGNIAMSRGSLQGNITKRGAVTIKNALPLAESYGPVSALTVYSNALDARAQGTVGLKDISGNTYNFVGNASKLYGMSGAATFVDWSKSGGYSTGSAERWEFVKWGNTVIAVNWNDNPQALTFGGSTFADLAGSPPKARHIAVIGPQVIMGNVFDSLDGNMPNRVWFGAIGSPTKNWVVDADEQSGYQTLQDGGSIKKIIGGSQYGYIFQEEKIRRMTYVGSPLVFDFDKIEDRGTRASGSVISVGGLIFYLAEDGFHVFNGEYSKPIGAGRVDKTFYNDLDSGFLDRISSSYDPINKIVSWAYPGAGNVGGNPNKIIIYSLAHDKWALIEQDLQILVDFRTQGYTLEELDTFSSSIDALSVSLDSGQWMGGTLAMGAFKSDSKLYTFEGSAMDAEFTTFETQLFKGRRATVTGMRPIAEGYNTLTCAAGSRKLLSGTVAWDAASSPHADTEVCDSLNDNRFHQFKMNISGGFNHAQGIEVEAKPSGER